MIDAYEPPAPRRSRRSRRGAGIGRAITEAPRGMLYQAYETDDERTHPRRPHRAADVAEPGADGGRPARVWRRPSSARSAAEATRLCETAIRNYDPCISCATHFLRLEIERR